MEDAQSSIVSALYKSFVYMLDIRFLVGTLLGWRFVTQVFGRPSAASQRSATVLPEQLKELQALVVALREELEQRKAELAEKDRDLSDVAAKLAEAEFAQLTLEAQVCQLEARATRLEAELEAAGDRADADQSALAAANVALRNENADLLARLRALQQQQQAERAAAAARQSSTAGRAQAAPAGAVSSGGDEERSMLREENETLRVQLEAVMEQNVVLQERLMELAFMPPVEPSEVSAFSPEGRRPRHRPLAEDEEIQRRIAQQSAAQMQLLFGEEGEEEGEGPDSPFLAAAQRQLQAYAQVKHRLSLGSRGEEEVGTGAGAGAHLEEAPEGGDEFVDAFDLRPRSLLHSESSTGTGSPAAVGSPTGVLSSQASGIGPTRRGKPARISGLGEESGEEEVSSAAL